VHAEEAIEARRIIESHRTELKGGEIVRLRDEFEPLQRTIGYRFRDRGLLEHALTHTSRANEDVSGGVRDNESMEFLGDALLGFVIADALFREFPESNEGEKSKTKAALVSTAALARQAERLNLGDHLLLGRGEEKTGGRRKQALLRTATRRCWRRSTSTAASRPARAFILREFASLIADVHQHGVSETTTSRRCRSCCRRAISDYRSTASPGRSAPITASHSRSKSPSRARSWPKRSGRARRKPSRRRHGCSRKAAITLAKEVRSLKSEV
jgi:dsRNA-specific ribonuclease